MRFYATLSENMMKIYVYIFYFALKIKTITCIQDNSFMVYLSKNFWCHLLSLKLTPITSIHKDTLILVTLSFALTKATQKKAEVKIL